MPLSSHGTQPGPSSSECAPRSASSASTPRTPPTISATSACSKPRGLGRPAFGMGTSTAGTSHSRHTIGVISSTVVMARPPMMLVPATECPAAMSALSAAVYSSPVAAPPAYVIDLPSTQRRVQAHDLQPHPPPVQELTTAVSNVEGSSWNGGSGGRDEGNGDRGEAGRNGNWGASTSGCASSAGAHTAAAAVVAAAAAADTRDGTSPQSGAERTQLALGLVVWGL
eukprot:CAMPEP_0198682996 /NCGR_PEP_ID=MMETSP1468-20131203/9838_1 /TAXON_ID=1461545 /ORGANISM="Mantoniella sp, Strain CCMP1436" /LENGTH=225 /DNA_ID=CAMNT_0044426595 /DNA_START=280 /DNA_END=958 /DNA_ORIENTATION=-